MRQFFASQYQEWKELKGPTTTFRPKKFTSSDGKMLASFGWHFRLDGRKKLDNLIAEARVRIQRDYPQVSHFQIKQLDSNGWKTISPILRVCLTPQAETNRLKRLSLIERANEKEMARLV